VALLQQQEEFFVRVTTLVVYAGVREMLRLGSVILWLVVVSPFWLVGASVMFWDTHPGMLIFGGMCSAFIWSTLYVSMPHRLDWYRSRRRMVEDDFTILGLGNGKGWPSVVSLLSFYFGFFLHAIALLLLRRRDHYGGDD
jgi:hypothetical protein